eukprot:gene27196-2445_t
MLNYLTKQIKAAYLNVTDLELKVLEVTNEEPWGPTGSQMGELARLAEDRDNYAQIMNMLHQRVADDLQRSVHILERLRDMFEYKDENGKDHGVNVRQRARDLVTLVNSPQRLSEERIKASKNSGKYKGVSSTDMKGGGYGGNSGGLGSNTGGLGSNSGGFGSSSAAYGGNSEAKKGPKKLSEVKVNPQFMNTFATLAAKQGAPTKGAPPAFRGDLLGGGNGMPAPLAPVSQPAVEDPFADFLVSASTPAPATTSPGMADPFGAQTSTAFPASYSSDPFASVMALPKAPPAVPPATNRDPFASLAAPPANGMQQPSAATDPFSSMLMAPTPSQAPLAHKPHMSSDPFMDFAAPPVAPPPTTGAMFGSFAGGSAAPATSNSDPFANFISAPAGGVQMGMAQPGFGAPTAPAMQVPKPSGLGATPLGVTHMGSAATEKAKAKDPFAGLGF